MKESQIYCMLLGLAAIALAFADTLLDKVYILILMGLFGSFGLIQYFIELARSKKLGDTYEIQFLKYDLVLQNIGKKVTDLEKAVNKKK